MITNDSAFKCLGYLCLLSVSKYTTVFFLGGVGAALDPLCCKQAFSSCAKWGLLSSCGAQASHRSGFSSCRAQSRCPAFNSCGTCVQLPRSMWDPPRPGITSMSPALGGGFLSTKPPREPRTVWWVLGCSRCPEDQAAPLPAATLAAPEECGT